MVGMVYVHFGVVVNMPETYFVFWVWQPILRVLTATLKPWLSFVQHGIVIDIGLCLVGPLRRFQSRALGGGFW